MVRKTTIYTWISFVITYCVPLSIIYLQNTSKLSKTSFPASITFIFIIIGLFAFKGLLNRTKTYSLRTRSLIRYILGFLLLLFSYDLLISIEQGVLLISSYVLMLLICVGIGGFFDYLSHPTDVKKQ